MHRLRREARASKYAAGWKVRWMPWTQTSPPFCAGSTSPPVPFCCVKTTRKPPDGRRQGSENPTGPLSKSKCGPVFIRQGDGYAPGFAFGGSFALMLMLLMSRVGRLFFPPPARHDPVTSTR